MKFNSLSEIRRYLEKNASSILNDSGIEKVLAKEMSKAVEDVVYSRYTPSVYNRRGDDGGLSDERNMKITKVEVKNGKVSILFENLTQGQTHFTPIYEQPIDSLHGKYITDTINNGLDNWYALGEWSQPRPFIQETINLIKSNPQPLINAIKNAYRKAGFNVR